MAHELMTIRIDSDLRARLRAAAGRRRLTPSAAARQAIEAWLAEQDAQAATRPFEQLADLIGRVEDPAARPGLKRARGARKTHHVRRGGAR